MHLMFTKTVILLPSYLDLFLKDGDRKTLLARELLEVDYKKVEMQLRKKDIYIGNRARSFLKQVSPGSPASTMHPLKHS